MDDIKSRAVAAAIGFLQRREYEILDARWEPGCFQAGIVASEEGEICFVGITVSGREEGFDSGEVDRASWEKAALSWLAEGECALDSPVRFDRMDLVVLNGERAFLRHHINALFEG